VTIVRVDDGDHLGPRVGLAQREVERAGLEARERVDVEEAEALAEAGAVRLDRLPDRRVLGVVVDHQDLEARIVQRRQASSVSIRSSGGSL
jgi:hypothetical protein